MIGVAIGGSLLYGASLSRALGSDALGSALWLTICAGLGWAALIPALILASKLSMAAILRDCLVSICFGEAVLALGAIGNFSQLWTGVLANSLVVLCSNVTMGAVLAGLLRQRGFSAWKTVAIWVVVLDGVGALAFWLLSFLLQGVSR